MQDTNSRKPEPITYRFNKIGPVKDAELELGDITVIAGRNNTGKTYLVYTLYGFLKLWKDFPNWFVLDSEKWSEVEFPDWDQLAEQLPKSGRYTFPLDQETFDRQRKHAIRLLTKGFSEHALSNVFSSQHGTFEGAFIEIIYNSEKSKTPRPFKSEITKGRLFSIEYDGTEVLVAMDEVKRQLPRHRLPLYFAFDYLIFLLDSLFPDPFILSAERFGISLFYRELDSTKNQLVDMLQKMGDDKNRDRFSPFLLIDKATSRYALPIKDNIDYTRSIPDLRGKKSAIHDNKLFDGIKDMLDGYYGASGDDIRFISKVRGKGRSFNIPLHLASSSARGLSDLYFFLRHVSSNNQLLIIDEPESHLDTANQILLARLLARFVKAGLKVLITTHSDYLIKEINNLVMLSRPFKDKEAVVKKLRYKADDFLEPDSIRAYVAENKTLHRCDVDQFGIDMPLFDKTIDKINKAANELSSRLSADSEV